MNEDERKRVLKKKRLSSAQKSRRTRCQAVPYFNIVYRLSSELLLTSQGSYSSLAWQEWERDLFGGKKSINYVVSYLISFLLIGRERSNLALVNFLPLILWQVKASSTKG